MPVLHPHQVAGLYVATPTLEPALQDNGWELDEGCTQPGGFSSTALFGHITAEAVDAEPVIVEGCTQPGGFSSTALLGHITTEAVDAALVIEDGVEVAVSEPVMEERLPDAREQELRFRSWRSRLIFVVSKAREMLYFQAAVLLFSYWVR